MNIFLKQFFRQFRHQKVYATIYLGSLIVSILAAYLIYTYVYQELRTDNIHSNRENIYRVLHKFKNNNYWSNSTPYPLAAELNSRSPEIMNYTQFRNYSSSSGHPFLLQTDDDTYNEENAIRTNKSFFQIFDFPLLYGSADQLEDQSNRAIISERLAGKMFGNPVSGMQESFMMRSPRGDTLGTFTIIGIMEDIPEWSSIQTNVILSFGKNEYKNHWGAYAYDLFLELHPQASKEKIAGLIPEIINDNFQRGTPAKFKLQSLDDMYFHSENVEDRLKHGSLRLIFILVIICLAIVAIALINYFTLKIALNYKKLTDVGIKKVMGAKKKDFQKEIYTDTLVNFLIVLAVVFLLAKVVTPWFNNTFDVQILSTDYQALLSFFVLIISFAVLFSFLIKKTAIKTPAVDAINKLTGKATGIRQRIRYLTIIQITVTIVFIASSIIFIRQINYLKYSDKGCDIENTFYVHSSFDKEQRDLFREQLKKYPVIQSITNSETLPLASTRFTHCKVNQNEFPVKFIFGDEKFLETYDLRLISGHNMDNSWIPRHRGMYVIPEKPYEVIVNETFVRQSGLDNPVGKVIQYFKDTEGKIVGVVEDFHYTSLRSKIQPVIISVRSGLSYSLLTIKYLPGHRKEALQIAKKEYSEFYPGKVFTPESYNFNEQYNREMLLMKAITLFTAIAVLLSVFGLFGISSLTIEDRTKEIGIRKVNGAKSKTVMAMLNTHFVRWVAIAFVIAAPIAWYAMQRWLQNFAYKIDLSWWIFVLAGVIALVIALLTVSWQSWRAARRNPVESLRYE